MSNVQKTDLELRNKIPDIEHPAGAEVALLPAPVEGDGARWSLVLILPNMSMRRDPVSSQTQPEHPGEDE